MSSVEERIPPITTVANGALDFGAGACSDGHGDEAQEATSAVIKHRAQPGQRAFAIAIVKPAPSSLKLRMYEIITSPLSTATPDKRDEAHGG
ncbi:MAG: hypothetical protein LKM38_22785 [Pseudomonas veronii]|nr:hypothetical protein [Pseudomonas veronii]